MYEIEPMPEKVKFQRAFDMVSSYKEFVLPFVQERLSYNSMHSLRSLWRAGIVSIFEHDTYRDNYERAFSNWLWIAHCSHDFLTDQLDNAGMADYKRLVMKMYIEQQNDTMVSVYRLFRNHSALAKMLLYAMQWITPLTSIQQDNGKVTCEVKECKVMLVPGATKVCRVECVDIGTSLAKSMYHIHRATELNNNGCMITLTPMKE